MEVFSEFFSRWTKEYYKGAKIGKEGDFYTAVSASKFFGGSIANFILKKLESGELNLPLKIVDVGANSGELLNDIKSFLDALGENVAPNCEFIALDFAQDSDFQGVRNLSELGILDKNTIFIANEFFDALPCELVSGDKMGFVENDEIIFREPLDSNLSELCARFDIKKGEIPLSYVDFARNLRALNPNNLRWIFIVFDYGEDFWRNDFSLRIYRAHRVFGLFDLKNLREFFGKSDITYNVAFPMLDFAFSNIGARRLIFKRQSRALIDDFGIIEVFEKFRDSLPPSDNLYLREANKIKTLLNVLNDSFKTAIYVNF